MICFFDTETTGRERTSNLVQLAAILTSDDLVPQAQVSLLVKPDGWIIPLEASKIHGITQAHAEENGLKLRAVCSIFHAIASRASRLVAHNIEYDRGIMNTAFDLIEVPNRPWSKLPIFCTMKASTAICKIPNPYPKFGPFKWPTLTEAYSFFHNGATFPNAHTALGDVLACIEVYRKLHNLPKAV